MKRSNIMDKILGQNILQEIASSVKIADYSPDKIIEGVKFIPLAAYPAEDGDLGEIFRLNHEGALEKFPTFKIAQMNRVRHSVKAIKAWHLHLNQDEVWYVSPYDHLFVGLWDVREKSKTPNLTMRIILGSTVSSLLFIPRGVAHGTANFIDRPVDLYSMLNEHFNPKKPDEIRISWDAIEKQFWEPLRD